jgi:hypothetical protein
MSRRYHFRENVRLDAALIRAAMRGGQDMFMHAAMGFGLQPSEAVARAEWTKRRPAYVRRVTAAIIRQEHAEKGV